MRNPVGAGALVEKKSTIPKQQDSMRKQFQTVTEKMNELRLQTRMRLKKLMQAEKTAKQKEEERIREELE